MSTENNALSLSVKTEYAVKVGANVRMYAPETVMVLGGRAAQALLQDAAYTTAFNKAKAGNYRAAVEIMALGATPSQVKGLAPDNGGTWTKARVMMLSELILGRKPAEGKAWSPRALKGRLMAEMIAHIDDKPAPTTAKEAAEDVDTLENVAQ